LDARLVDERAPLAERAACIGGLAVEAQATTAEAAAYPDPSKVEGAWFIDDVTRMDDQQHALSALLLTIPILEAAPFDTGHPAPVAWLWILVVIGTINPVRAAFSMPRDGTPRRRASLAALGGLLGSAILLLVASGSGWVIDQLGTSAPAMRLAAGSLCLLSAAIDVARRPSADEPALPGPWAAVMPVAVPLFMRPALLIAGLSIVADRGMSTYAIALGLSVAALIALSAIPVGDDTDRPVLVWAGRLMSFAAVAGSVLLIADAVFDI